MRVKYIFLYVTKDYDTRKRKYNYKNFVIVQLKKDNIFIDAMQNKKSHVDINVYLHTYIYIEPEKENYLAIYHFQTVPEIEGIMFKMVLVKSRGYKLQPIFFVDVSKSVFDRLID